MQATVMKPAQAATAAAAAASTTTTTTPQGTGTPPPSAKSRLPVRLLRQNHPKKHSELVRVRAWQALSQRHRSWKKVARRAGLTWGALLLYTTGTAHLADVQNGPLYSHSQRSASSTPTAAGTHQQPHSEPSLPSPPLSRGRHGEAPSQSQHKHPSAPFPSYPFAPSTDQHPSRSHTPASQQGHETAALYRSISPLSNATTTAGSGYQFNRQAFLAQSLAGRSAAGPNNSSSTALQAPLTWAELADPDLVDNLGGRERTRQEVLWEIVASEER